MLQVLQDTAIQVFSVGFHKGSDLLFHMSCHGLLEVGNPTITYASLFVAQLVSYKLGEPARCRQISWFHGAVGHTQWQGARGYWFETMAHKVLSSAGCHTFRLLGERYCCAVCVHCSGLACYPPAQTSQMPMLALDDIVMTAWWQLA